MLLDAALASWQADAPCLIQTEFQTIYRLVQNDYNDQLPSTEPVHSAHDAVKDFPLASNMLHRARRDRDIANLTASTAYALLSECTDPHACTLRCRLSRTRECIQKQKKGSQRGARQSGNVGVVDEGPCHLLASHHHPSLAVCRRSICPLYSASHRAMESMPRDTRSDAIGFILCSSCGFPSCQEVRQLARPLQVMPLSAFMHLAHLT